MMQNANKQTTPSASFFDINGVEIFRTGDFGDKGAYTEADLDAIASGYDPKAKHEAFLSRDHKQGGNSEGWVKRVYRKGKSLFADLSQVSDKLVADLKSGAVKKRSVEIYRDFDGAGPYLKAVTFLGAMAPHVKGMEDIQLSDTRGAFVTFGETLAIDTPTADITATFGEIPTSPEGAAHGVLVASDYADEMLGHTHDIFMDADGNGFTGAARMWACNDGVCGYSTEGHQHVVTAGVIQPYGDETIPLHSHSYTRFQSRTVQPGADAIPQETTAMSDPNQANEAKFAELEAKFNALAAEHADTKARLDATTFALEQSKKDAAFAEEFSGVWSECLSKGQVKPADRETKFAMFKALAAAPVVTFADNSTVEPRALFLNDLKASPVIVPIGPQAKPGAPVSKFADADPHATVKRLTAEKIAAAPSMTEVQATTAVFKENPELWTAVGFNQ